FAVFLMKILNLSHLWRQGEVFPLPGRSPENGDDEGRQVPGAGGCRVPRTALPKGLPLLAAVVALEVRARVESEKDATAAECLGQGVGPAVARFDLCGVTESESGRRCSGEEANFLFQILDKGVEVSPCLDAIKAGVAEEEIVAKGDHRSHAQ